MTEDRLPAIAIVGGGAAGWMAAAALAGAFKGRGKVTLVELPNPQGFELGDAAIPTLRAFNERLGIAEGDFIRETHATFKLGSEFRDWTGPGTLFLHPFGQYGTSVGTVGFHHCWFKMRALGDRTALADYSLAGVAASLGRFARPVADARSVLSSFAYGYHFDADRYVSMLRGHALSHGVVCKQSARIAVQRRKSDGFIDVLGLDNEEQLRADLYVDCTGAAGLLIEDAPGAGYEDWSRWLPCNAAIACQGERSDDLRPLSQIAAHDAGWQWCIPLQGCTSNGFVYCNAFVSDEDAANALSVFRESNASGESIVARFRNGRRKEFWTGNCVALGAAAGFLEPLESTSAHLILSGIARLLQLLPSGSIEAADRYEYNRLTGAEYEQIRDFLILHYHANGRTGSAFWDAARTAEIPETLATRIELFRSRGRVAPHAGDIFLLPNWLSLFAGLNILPRRHHPFADGLSVEELKRQMSLMRLTIRQAAESMPNHDAFVARATGRA